MSDPAEKSSISSYFGLSNLDSQYTLTDVMRDFHSKLQPATENEFRKLESVYLRKITFYDRIPREFLMFELVRGGSASAYGTRPILYMTLERMLDSKASLDDHTPKFKFKSKSKFTNADPVPMNYWEEKSLAESLSVLFSVRPQPLKKSRPLFMFQLVSGQQFGVRSEIRFSTKKPSLSGACSVVRSHTFFPEGSCGQDQEGLRRWSLFEIILMAQTVSQLLPSTTAYDLSLPRYYDILYDTLLREQVIETPPAPSDPPGYGARIVDFLAPKLLDPDLKMLDLCKEKFGTYKALYERLKEDTFGRAHSVGF